VATLVLGPAAALAQRAGQGSNNPFRSILVRGTATDGQSFTGTFDIERFEAVGETLVAVGQLNGKFSGGKPVNHQAAAFPVTSVAVDDAGGPLTAASRPRTAVPATFEGARRPTIIEAQGQTCNVLTLDLGPLHLDLLGLVVDLNAIHLVIDAQQGSGNLLGNLLCAVANLLNPGGGLSGTLQQLGDALSAVANALNGLLAGLGL
jgi:hypothetical protein